MNLQLFEQYLDRIAGIDHRFSEVMGRVCENAKTRQQQVNLSQGWICAFLDNLCPAQDLSVWRGACLALDGAR